jgi:hypothetical protein
MEMGRGKEGMNVASADAEGCGKKRGCGCGHRYTDSDGIYVDQEWCVENEKPESSGSPRSSRFGGAPAAADTGV